MVGELIWRAATRPSDAAPMTPRRSEVTPKRRGPVAGSMLVSPTARSADHGVAAGDALAMAVILATRHKSIDGPPKSVRLSVGWSAVRWWVLFVCCQTSLLSCRPPWCPLSTTMNKYTNESVKMINQTACKGFCIAIPRCKYLLRSIWHQRGNG